MPCPPIPGLDSPAGLRLIALVALFTPGLCWAQANKTAKAADPPADTAALESGSTKEVIETEDGVYLALTLWRVKAVGSVGKETPVAILMHAHGENQRTCFPLAKQLNDAGLAVVTFDLRGHGESRRIKRDVYVDPRGKQPDGDIIDQATEFRKDSEAANAFMMDLETVKRFLIDQNNKEALNLKQSGLVAVGPLSSAVALKWLVDAEYASPYRRELHALVLISPSRRTGDFRFPQSLEEDLAELPVFLISSNAKGSRDDVERMARMLNVRELTNQPDQRSTPKAAQPADAKVSAPDTKAKAPDAKGSKAKAKPAKTKPASADSKYRPDSGWFHVPVMLAETKLIHPPANNVDSVIANYLKFRLDKRPDLAWEPKDPERAKRAFGAARKQ